MKLEDASILTLDEIGTADCIICGSVLKLVKEGDNYSGSHCDREYFVAPIQYKSKVKKVDVKPELKEPEVTEVSIEEFSDDFEERPSTKKINGAVVKPFYVK